MEGVVADSDGGSLFDVLTINDDTFFGGDSTSEGHGKDWIDAEVFFDAVTKVG